MHELLLLACLVTTTVLITLFVVDFKERKADSQSRIDFKADFLKTGAAWIETNNRNAEEVKKLLERVSALEMKIHMGTRK